MITDSKQNFFNSLQNAYGKKIAFVALFTKLFNLTQGIWEQKLLIFLFFIFSCIQVTGEKLKIHDSDKSFFMPT